MMYCTTTSCVSLPALRPHTLHYQHWGIRGLQVQSHGSKCVLTVSLWLSLGRESLGRNALAHIPFSQQTSPAPTPTCPSGWPGPARCCCLGPQVSQPRAAGPCSAAPGRAPPWPPRLNTTPARSRGARVRQSRSRHCLSWRASL